jgi:hypothetical protein
MRASDSSGRQTAKPQENIAPGMALLPFNYCAVSFRLQS